MRMRLLIGLIASGLFALAVPAQAHQHHGAHGHHADCACPGCCDSAAAGYDVDAVTTLRGTATAVTVVPARGGRSGGSHLTLESDGKAVDVHLGPSGYLGRHGLALAKGDALEVTGSLVERNGATILIAREVRKGDKVVRLRDERGVPAWSGGPRH